MLRREKRKSSQILDFAPFVSVGFAFGSLSNIDITSIAPHTNPAGIGRVGASIVLMFLRLPQSGINA